MRVSKEASMRVRRMSCGGKARRVKGVRKKKKVRSLGKDQGMKDPLTEVKMWQGMAMVMRRKMSPGSKGGPGARGQGSMGSGETKLALLIRVALLRGGVVEQGAPS